MRLRTPPGRAGRLWLRHRMDIAEHATGLLDYKRRELTSELQRLDGVRRRARAELQHALADATDAMAAVDVDGGTPWIGAASAAQEPAGVEVEWRAVMGVHYPTRATVADTAPVPVSMLPGGEALAVARDAHRRALAAAVSAGAAESAHARVQAEWKRTTRAARALELRAIPAHAEALAALELTLDEREREDAIRVRWAGAGRGRGGPR